MKIGVTADTHSLPIPPKVIEAFKSVDFIIHAGDFCTLDDLKIFQRLRDVKAVYGNMDDKSLQKKLPGTVVFEVEGVKIGIFHGEGSRKTVLSSVKNKFEKIKLDVVIFGVSRDSVKSHQNFCQKQGYQFELLSDVDEKLCQLFDVIK